MSEDPTPLQAMREAQDAARESMKASQRIGDESGVIKASRAISDISARISRLSPDGREVNDPPSRQQQEFVADLVKALQADEKTRQRVVQSLISGLNRSGELGF